MWLHGTPGRMDTGGHEIAWQINGQWTWLHGVMGRPGPVLAGLMKTGRSWHTSTLQLTGWQLQNSNGHCACHFDSTSENGIVSMHIITHTPCIIVALHCRKAYCLAGSVL